MILISFSNEYMSHDPENTFILTYFVRLLKKYKFILDLIEFYIVKFIRSFISAGRIKILNNL